MAADPMTNHQGGGAAEEAAPDIRASVRVYLVNPESGYESETTAQVTAAEWAVIDAILCGRGAPYAAAPALLEAATALIASNDATVTAMTECSSASEAHRIAQERGAEFSELLEPLRQAIRQATGPDQNRGVG